MPASLRSLVLVLLLYAAVATAVGHVDYRIREYRDLGYAKYVPEVLAGTQWPPAKYRVLAPLVYDRLRQATRLEPIEAWVLYEWLCIFAALVAAHFYFSAWFDRGPAVAGSLLVAALVPLTFTNNYAVPDQLMELFLFTLGCACIARQIDWAFLGVLVAAGFNRETSAFLVPLYLLSRPFERRHLIWAAFAAALWAGTYVGLRAWLGFVKYDPWMMQTNLTNLKLLGA